MDDNLLTDLNLSLDLNVSYMSRMLSDLGVSTERIRLDDSLLTDLSASSLRGPGWTEVTLPKSLPPLPPLPTRLVCV